MYLDYHIKEFKAAEREKRDEMRKKGIVWKGDEEALSKLPKFDFNETVSKKKKKKKKKKSLGAMRSRVSIVREQTE